MTMWLKLDLEDIDFRFRISRYEGKPWCKVDLKLKAQKWLNYNMVHREVLEYDDVERICDRIEGLLNNKFDKPKGISFAEPDLEFILYPSFDIRNNPDVLYIKPGSNTILDVTMELIVSFWDEDGALTANQLKLVFDREDIEKLHCYLKYVAGRINEEDETLQKLMTEGIIYNL